MCSSRGLKTLLVARLLQTPCKETGRKKLRKVNNDAGFVIFRLYENLRRQ
jgi:hypothetical protein